MQSETYVRLRAALAQAYRDEEAAVLQGVRPRTRDAGDRARDDQLAILRAAELVLDPAEFEPLDADAYAMAKEE